MADTPVYITDPIEVDETSLQNDSYDYLQENWPDWVPNDSNLETWMIPANTRIGAYVAEIASQAPPSIFRYLGSTILGIPPIAASTATVESTWTISDNPAGRTIAAGTLVALDDGDGNPIAFEVDEDVTVGSPDLTTAVGGVVLRAVEEGVASNGLGGAGVEADMLDPVVWVDAVTLTSVTEGGADEESPEAYQNRLSARLTLYSERLILARDAEPLVRDIAAQNGVDVRALALDNYNPVDDTFDNERMLAVVMSVLGTGAHVSSGLKTIVDAQLQALREVNFIVNVIDPDDNTVDVTFTITPVEGADPDVALANALSAVETYLSPGNWGLPPGSTTGWIQQSTLRRQEISTVINNADSVDHWDTLTIGVNGAGQTTAETFTLTGAAPLTVPDDIVGTLT